MAQRPQESITEQAASFLRARADIFQDLSSTPDEIHRQGQLLVEWSRERGRLLDSTRFAGLVKYPTETHEHEVFYDRPHNIVLKRTYPGRYGLAHGPKGRRRNATPLYYLERLLLMQQVFADDVQFEGMVFGKDAISITEKPCIVITQGLIDPANDQDPHPSEQQVDQFMTQHGFVKMEHACQKWHREADSVVVLDAREANFVLSEEGILPVDLIIGRNPLLGF